jgi:hypothetical protein
VGGRFIYQRGICINHIVYYALFQTSVKKFPFHRTPTNISYVGTTSSSKFNTNIFNYGILFSYSALKTKFLFLGCLGCILAKYRKLMFTFYLYCLCYSTGCGLGYVESSVWTIKLCSENFVAKHSNNLIQILPKYSSHTISATAYTIIQSQLQPKYICYPN